MQQRGLEVIENSPRFLCVEVNGMDRKPVTTDMTAALLDTCTIFYQIVHEVHSTELFMSCVGDSTMVQPRVSARGFDIDDALVGALVSHFQVVDIA